MVKARFFYSDQEIEEVILEGHALFDNPGRDIVCAAVSAVAFGFLNSFDQLFKQDCKLEVDRKIQIKVKKNSPSLQILLQAFEISLATIQEQYPLNLKIIKEVSN